MKLYLSILVKFNLSLVFCQLTWFPTSNQKSSLFSQLHKDHQTKQSSCILFPLFAEVSQTCLIQMCCPSFFVRLNRKLRLQIPLDFLFWVIDGLSRPGQGLRDLSPFNSSSYILYKYSWTWASWEPVSCQALDTRWTGKCENVGNGLSSVLISVMTRAPPSDHTHLPQGYYGDLWTTFNTAEFI